MVLSRLRRFFSSKSSSSSSSAYRRLQPAPIGVGVCRPPPQASPPLRVTINDGDCGPAPSPQASPPRRVTISDGDCGPPPSSQASPPPSPQASPPRRVTISDGDCGGCGDKERRSAMIRIENELRVMNDDSPTHCSFGPVGDDVFRWDGVVIGPACSCYEGGIFRLSIEFPSDYPSTPPLITFRTKIFHPNVGEDGTIYIDILKENWSPALTIEKLLLSICSILSNPDAQHSINKASTMYIDEWLNYYQIAREWTKIYAMES